MFVYLMRIACVCDRAPGVDTVRIIRVFKWPSIRIRYGDDTDFDTEGNRTGYTGKSFPSPSKSDLGPELAELWISKNQLWNPLI